MTAYKIQNPTPPAQPTLSIQTYISTALSHYRKSLHPFAHIESLLLSALSQSPSHVFTLQTLETLRLLQRLKEQGNYRVNIAAIKEKKGDKEGWKKGLEEAMEAYEEYLSVDDVGGVARVKVLSNLGIIAGKLNNPTEAKDYFSQAITLMQPYTSKDFGSPYALLLYKLHKRRADAYSREAWYEEALTDYELALSLHPNGPVPEVHYRRGIAYLRLSLPASAYEQFEIANTLVNGTNPSYLEALRNARRHLETDSSSKPKRPPNEDPDSTKQHHATLGLPRTATSEEIKRAYRKLVVKYHPDKHATSSEEVKEEAEKKVKEINEAFAVLSGRMERLGLQSPR
ncbi:hypothetical protein HK097_008639 [Rhizophlyctis rosea]|uniref:J domain-containing protein n=1 Tax=Rhizophlyctis rosea TaxID=64517 RepID=A0AAD5SA36_9FUNG|nr:hypothetical protein HK097_008639 [Rhizophlyctis rosea]